VPKVVVLQVSVIREDDAEIFSLDFFYRLCYDEEQSHLS